MESLHENMTQFIQIIKYDMADIASNEKLLAWANMSAV